jgi:hypothetical protein
MSDIVWLEKDRDQPKDQWGLPKYDSEARSYTVWANLTDRAEWMDMNSAVPECALAGPGLTEQEANRLVDRLHLVYGTYIRLGISAN